MNNTHLGLDIISDLTNYRLYLRHSFYPHHYGELMDLLYQNIPAVLDVQYDDTGSQLNIRTRKRKGIAESAIFYPATETALIRLYDQAKLDAMVFSDPILSQDQKQRYLQLHDMIRNGYVQYLKYLYNMVMIDQMIYLYI